MSDISKVKVTNVTIDNIEETGFFCYMSKRKTEGYKQKQRWLMDRFSEGMRVKMVKDGGRGFIEYIPGKYAWRAVDAGGYMFVHCIWIVGQSKSRGIGTLLLNECVRDAKREGMKGVAMATSEGNWLVGQEFLEKNGFRSVDHAPPSFELMARKFNGSSEPLSFTGCWEEKMKRLGNGLTVVRTDQCPYIQASTMSLLEAAREKGIESRIVELRSSDEVRRLAPTAYGVFGAVYNGQLLSYHPLGRERFLERLAAIRQENQIGTTNDFSRSGVNPSGLPNS